MYGKIITATIGAAGLGALWGWAITGDRMEQELREKEAYLLAMRSMYLEVRNAYDELVEVVADDALARMSEEGEISPGDEVPGEDVTEEAEEAGEDGDEEGEVDEEAYEAARSNLQAVIDRYAADPQVSETFDRMVRRDHEVEGARQRPPEVISKATYAWSEDGDDYQKITVTWFPRFRVLVDEDEEVIEDVNNVLGFRNLNRFGDESDHPDVVFIRNFRLMVDYEVVREEDENPPLHVTYGMPKQEFETQKTAGTLRLRDEDRDRS